MLMWLMLYLLLSLLSAPYLFCAEPETSSNPSITETAPQEEILPFSSNAIATWRLMSHIPLKTWRGTTGYDHYQMPLGVEIPMEGRRNGKHIFVQKLAQTHFSDKKQASVIACISYKRAHDDGVLVYVLVETSPKDNNQYLIEVSAVQPGEGVTILLDKKVTTPCETSIEPRMTNLTNPNIETLLYPLPSCQSKPWPLQISASRDNIFTLKLGTENAVHWFLNDKQSS